MKTKIVGIFVCILVMITAFSISGTATHTNTATSTKSQQNTLVIEAISGGFSIHARIKYIGSANVVCTLTLSGLVFPTTSTKPCPIGTDTLGYVTWLVLGLGKITITVTAVAGSETTTTSIPGTAFFFFVRVK